MATAAVTSSRFMDSPVRCAGHPRGRRVAHVLPSGSRPPASYVGTRRYTRGEKLPIPAPGPSGDSGSLVPAQDVEELVVGAEQVGLVATLEPGAPAGWMLEHAGVGVALQRHHPGPGRQVLHGQPLEAAARRDGEPADQERLLVDDERLEHVE